MTRSEDLLYSLATVIIRYHDKQSGVKILITESDESLVRKKSRILAKRIINDSKTDFKERFDSLITECPKHHPDRRPFLSFILNELSSLKLIIDHQNSFSPSQLEEYKQQIIEMLKGFKGLLSTSKGTTSIITQHKTATSPGGKTSLEGLIDTSYLNSGQLCNSGIFLKEELMDRYNLDLDSTDTELSEFAQQLCQEHQNTLLVTELTAPKEAHSVISDTEHHEIKVQLEESSEIEKKLKSTISKQQLALYLLFHQYSMLKSSESHLKKTIQRHEETIEYLTQKVDDLKILSSNDASSPVTPGFGFFGLNL